MKSSRIWFLIGAFLIGFGGGIIHIGLGIIFAGLMCFLVSYLEFEEENGNKDTKEGNTEGDNR